MLASFARACRPGRVLTTTNRETSHAFWNTRQGPSAGHQPRRHSEGLQGDDTLERFDGNDTLYGGEDNDVLYGDGGNDRLFGETGNDELFGGAGNDVLSGGEGNDLVEGEDGDDTLTGDKGKDLMFGVIAVTAVDEAGQPLRRAARGEHMPLPRSVSIWRWQAAMAELKPTQARHLPRPPSRR
ncbi:MAG: hypothetical protein ACOVN4_16385 [Bosea sp. (in: a-proteobacteria)]